jgi:methyltransferase (TIGR00027 family)
LGVATEPAPTEPAPTEPAPTEPAAAGKTAATAAAGKTPGTAAAGTAAWIAAARARESARPDRLFDDPWAGLLAGDAGRIRLAASERAGGENTFLPVRTRYFDDVLVAASGWAAQIVLLGAGLDTRAYRLGLPPEATVFEIDQPGTLAAKESVLSAAGARPVCARIAVEADLRGDWAGALTTAGFDPALATAWRAEGLLFYLDDGAAPAIISRAAALSGSRSLFAADMFGTGLLRLPGMRPWLDHLERTGARPPFCTDEPAGLMLECGWPGTTVTQPGQRGANFGRLPVVPEHRHGGGDPAMRTYLVVATR